MSYVDGYVIPIKKKHLKAYAKMAAMGKKVWKKFGALDYKECVAEDIHTQYGLSFPKGIKVRPGETVVFSYIVYRSRAHRDQVNKKVMKEMEKLDSPPEMPFDVRRMIYGGFKTLVE